MIRSLSDIENLSVLDQNPYENISSVNSVSFIDTNVGSGGFGEVFKVLTINGERTDNLVVKIITHLDSEEHTLEVVQLLHKKLKRRQFNSGIPIYHEFPELLGLPFLAFKAYDDILDRTCSAFIMYDLSVLGFEDYGSETENSMELKNLDIQDRLYLCFQLSKVMSFLHEIKFIHADLKESSIWIHPHKKQITLIDFDSGYHYDKQAGAITLGAIGQWISGGLRTLISKGENPRNIPSSERISEENWILSNAFFEIIFGVMPFFFLKDSDDETKKKYLRGYKWPEADFNDDIFIPSNNAVHNQVLTFIESFKESEASEFIEALIEVINKGYSNKSKRITAAGWKNILYDLNLNFDSKPKLLKFETHSKTIHKKNTPLIFHFSGIQYNALYLNGKLQDLNERKSKIEVEDEGNVILKLVNDFGTIEESIYIKANKIDPVITSLKASSEIRETLDPITLYWSSDNTSKIFVSSTSTELPPEGKLEVEPTEKVTYIVKAIGYFDQVVEREITIEVAKPSILFFEWEINLHEGIDNVDLNWDTENATHVIISPVIGQRSSKDLAHIHLSEPTEFILNAHGHFGLATAKLRASPFNAPSIEHIFMKSPQIELVTIASMPELDVNMQLPTFKGLYIDNSIQFTNSHISFAELIDSVTPQVSNQKIDETDIFIKNHHAGSESLYRKIKQELHKRFKI